eukprot:TRINITY_DN4385_c0_g1_i3.p1 TRINITY_DN4385_c0_g1~~TRINITY_DN4385_c0_g1_i3.p1  ORF type:complete len:113 (-),score=7.98 TRINITY_DN4385_c0_g1_i3:218-556(-)
MSRARKHVTQTVLTSFPEPEKNQKIVQVLALKGSNICEVEYPTGEKHLYRFPSKFNKRIWIKRGDYLIVQPYEDFTHSKKIRGDITNVLYDKQIKHLKNRMLWAWNIYISIR